MANWTKVDRERLRECYRNRTTYNIVWNPKLLKRFTGSQIRSEACALGLTIKQKHWLDSDTKLLKECYENRTTREIQWPPGLLKRFSVGHCVHRACKLGISRKKAQWTEGDLRLLRKAYHKGGDRKKIYFPAELLSRRSRSSCLSKAWREGVVVKTHRCWDHSRIISKEKNYTSSGRGKKKLAGFWRFRECTICGNGWETLESKYVDRKTRKPSPNRIRPLAEGT